MNLLTVNAGSSTIKFGVFDTRSGSPKRVARASIDLSREPLALEMSMEGRRVTAPLDLPSDPASHVEAAVAVLEREFASGTGFKAAGHRVVHGGDDFKASTRLDDAVLDLLDALVPLAPLHQPQNLAAIRSLQRLRPDIMQVAAFDTAFHQTQAPLQRRFALPRALHEAGVKRYGFHGLSYASIKRSLQDVAPELLVSRVVVAHLGSGASLCALENGVSRDTSMGFSTLDGLPMATRCGALDAGVLLHLMTAHSYTADDLAELLYRRSGLLGLSGISGDIRDLIADGSEPAREAIAYFAIRTAREVAALATTLGGLDAIIFTGGIGEHQPAVRAQIAGHLEWLGLSLDAAGNLANARRIASADSRIAALVIPTDEEQVIAMETCRCLSEEPRP